MVATTSHGDSATRFMKRRYTNVRPLPFTFYLHNSGVKTYWANCSCVLSDTLTKTLSSDYNKGFCIVPRTSILMLVSTLPAWLRAWQEYSPESDCWMASMTKVPSSWTWNRPLSWFGNINVYIKSNPINSWFSAPTRQHGPCWRVMETGHPSTRAVNSGSGNRA